MNDRRGVEVDVAIVGAGFAGMYAIYRFREMGLSVQAYDVASDVGGTWWWNRYPGARCDIESVDYSYSFSPELDQEWTWTERYSTQPEILRYADHVAERFDLRRHVQFETRVDAARWDDDVQRWHVATDRGDELSARFLVMATGCLSTTKQPEVPGIDSFAGPVLHTGRWPHEPVDFSGKRVGVIGTGSSGIQSIPVIAEQAGHLTVFQRTPNYTSPAHNARLTAEDMAAVKATYPERRVAQRHSMGGTVYQNSPTFTMSALEASEDERQRAYDAAWERGALFAFVAAFNDIVLDADANETAAEYVRRRIRDTVKDPEVAERLSPRNHPIGTKRPCLDDGYYDTFNRPNVTLVDLHADPIESITPTGIRTASGEHPLDMLVFATGFDAMTGPLLGPLITGRDGVTLREKWADGPITYLGLTVAGFPNMFTITGPGSPSVLTNMIVSIEQHIDWVAGLITHLDTEGLAVAEATDEAAAGWTRHVAEVADATLFPRANSWYMGANVPGKPRVFLACLGGIESYAATCDRIAADGYAGFRLLDRCSPTPAEAMAAGRTVPSG